MLTHQNLLGLGPRQGECKTIWLLMRSVLWQLLVVASIETGKLLPSTEVSRFTEEIGLCLPKEEIGTAFPCLPLSTWLATEASMVTWGQRLCIPEGEVGTMLPCLPGLLWPTRPRAYPWSSGEC